MNTIKSHTAARRTKIALWLLITPTVVIIISFGLFLMLNLVFNPTLWPTPDGESPLATPTVITVLNGIFITIGVAGLIAWLPGVITGIMLLNRRSRTNI